MNAPYEGDRGQSPGTGAPSGGTPPGPAHRARCPHPPATPGSRPRTRTSRTPTPMTRTGPTTSPPRTRSARRCTTVRRTRRPSPGAYEEPLPPLPAARRSPVRPGPPDLGPDAAARAGGPVPPPAVRRRRPDRAVHRRRRPGEPGRRGAGTGRRLRAPLRGPAGAGPPRAPAVDAPLTTPPLPPPPAAVPEPAEEEAPPPPPKKSGGRASGLLKSSAVTAAGTLVSRLTGFLRTLVITGALGAATLGDATPSRTRCRR